MPRLQFETVLRCTPEQLWDFHSSAAALRVLTPPSKQVEVIGEDLAVRDGAIHKIRVRQFGLPLVWVARIEQVQPPHQFVDVAVKSPFKSWTHRHEFLAHAEGALLRDTIDFEMPLGPLGSLVYALIVRRDLESMFAHRHKATKEALESGRGVSG